MCVCVCVCVRVRVCVCLRFLIKRHCAKPHGSNTLAQLSIILSSSVHAFPLSVSSTALTRPQPLMTRPGPTCTCICNCWNAICTRSGISIPRDARAACKLSVYTHGPRGERHQSRTCVRPYLVRNDAPQNKRRVERRLRYRNVCTQAHSSSDTAWWDLGDFSACLDVGTEHEAAVVQWFNPGQDG